jgi:hypothetical protein
MSLTNIVAEMKFVIGVVIVILGFSGQISAQENDTIVQKIAGGKSKYLMEAPVGILSESPKFPLQTDGIINGSDFQLPVLMPVNHDFLNGWNIGKGSSVWKETVYDITFGIHPFGLYRRSMWELYEGEYAARTYQVNNKLFIGTSGYSFRSFDEHSKNTGMVRQTNFNSSLFVGYKFSDKFSISAGFSIRSNRDPLSGKQGPNGGMFP